MAVRPALRAGGPRAAGRGGGGKEGMPSQRGPPGAGAMRAHVPGMGALPPRSADPTPGGRPSRGCQRCWVRKTVRAKGLAGPGGCGEAVVRGGPCAQGCSCPNPGESPCALAAPPPALPAPHPPLSGCKGGLTGREPIPLSEPLGSEWGRGPYLRRAILQVWLATRPGLRPRGAGVGSEAGGGARSVCSVGWRMLRAGSGLRPALDCGQGSGTFWG